MREEGIEAMSFLSRRKEYLTVDRTPEELKQQEPRLRAAGFRKRRLCNGVSPNTGEYYQWWDKVGARNWRNWRAVGLCIRCGEKVATSTRGRKSQWCILHLEEYRRYARNYYHEKLKRSNGSDSVTADS